MGELMADYRGPSNKYSSTPRKIFDKHVDRMEVRRKRDREDHRADMQALIKRLLNLEDQLKHLTEHVSQHCDRFSIDHEDEVDAYDSRDS